MRKSDLTILIIEDDVSSANALVEGLKRSGYKPIVATDPETSVSTFKLHDVHAVLVDCMLPKMNGVELAEQLRQVGGQDFKLIFISGIFKDKSFIKDALSRTNGMAFLTKPFDLEELLKTLESAFADVLEEDRPLLFDFPSQDGFSSKERLQAISESPSAQGQDLPLFYSLLFGSKLSGDLVIKNESKDDSIISWSEGKVVQVALKDNTSYFGVLLVERGFTSTEELEEGLNSTSNKPIGERLVDASALSPHAIELVHKDQMGIRLSKTVQSGSVEVHFREGERQPSGAYVDEEDFIHLLNDWMTSKQTHDWLASFYRTWMTSPIHLTANGNLIRRVRQNTDLPAVATVIENLDQRPTLEELLDSLNLEEDDIYQAIHLLTLTKVIVFETAKKGISSYESRMKRLQKIKEDLQDSNYFEVLGLSPNASSNRINQSYIELAKTLHPDKIEQDAPKELHELAKEIFAIINRAYDTLKDSNKRSEYVKTLEKGRAEEALQGEALFEEGRQYLANRKYQEALDVFRQVAQMKNHRSDLYIYLAWAKLKRGTSKSKMQRLIDSVAKDLRQVPPEDRHCAEYFFVKAIYYRKAGIFDKAQKNLKHARAIDPSFIEVKREMVYLKESHLRWKQRNSSSITSDLTQLTKAVGRLFGGKKRR